jgi:hypothetical protein
MSMMDSLAVSKRRALLAARISQITLHSLAPKWAVCYEMLVRTGEKNCMFEFYFCHPKN